MRRLVIALTFVTCCCVGPQPRSAPTDSKGHAPAPHSTTRKLTAPVSVSLKADGSSGRVQVFLEVTASGLCPEARYEVKVPRHVTVAAGQLIGTIGTLPKDRRFEASFVLQVPAEKPAAIAAGVTCRVASNAALVRSAVLNLGAPRAPEEDQTRTIKIGGAGTRLNVAPAVQQDRDKDKVTP